MNAKPSFSRSPASSRACAKVTEATGISIFRRYHQEMPTVSAATAMSDGTTPSSRRKYTSATLTMAPKNAEKTLIRARSPMRRMP